MCNEQMVVSVQTNKIVSNIDREQRILINHKTVRFRMKIIMEFIVIEYIKSFVPSMRSIIFQ